MLWVVDQVSVLLDYGGQVDLGLVDILDLLELLLDLFPGQHGFE